MYPLINIFGKTIGTYALCAIIGLFISGIFFRSKTQKTSVGIDDMILFMLPTVAGLLVGGHLLYGITNFHMIMDLIQHLHDMPVEKIFSVLLSCFGGSVFYGGMIGAYLSFVFAVRHFNIKEQQILRDTFSNSIPLFHIFGRIGCFLGGCCYGIESSFGFTVYNNPLVPELNGISRVPVALIEAFGNLVIFLILCRISKKFLFQGKIMYLYMIMYSCLRFHTEFLRGDIIRGIHFGLSTSQWISIILFIVSSILLLRNIKPAKAIKKFRVS